jgi:hypothetical protein
MNNLENNLTDLIYLFVDGETNSTQDELLFKELANNPDLQKELQDTILIKTNLQNDASSLIVPASTTERIFLNAGVALPNSPFVPPIANATGSSAVIAKISSIKPILLSVGIFVTGFIASYLLLNSEINNIPFTNKANFNSNLLSQKSTDLQQDKTNLNNVISKSKGTPIEIAKSKEFSNLSNYKEVEISEKEIATAEDVKTNPILENNSITLAEPIYSNNELQFEKAKISNFNSIELPINISSIENDFNLPLAFGLRGMMNLSSFPNNNASYVNGLPNNFTASIGYDIDEENRIGIEGGSQALNFYTNEANTENGGILNRSFVWAGITYRKTFQDNLIDNLKPFLQTTLGGTIAGPIGRLQAGLKWQPEQRISLSAGIEGSSLMYQKNNNSQFHQNVGIFYQVEINLNK